MRVLSVSKFVRAAAFAFMLAVCMSSARAQSIPPLYTQGRTFNITDHIVSTSVFHWYTPFEGQLSGPWLPLDGRPNWTGEPAWWKSQIKQMMMANIDVLWVHLIPHFETQRINLFTALSQLRAEGYDVPKVAPFLDPMITWDGQPKVNVATAAGKDEFTNQYIRFFNQYFSVNTDPFADSYIEQIGGKVVLDTWHVQHNLSNLSSLTRTDVESRLAAAFGQAHPIFNNGIRMVTTAYNPPTLAFADEKVAQFEVHQYYNSALANGVGSVQLKGGYWDQNIRTPGYCLKRDGGLNYKNAWGKVNRSSTHRVYIESWNEYDEGSGIYAAVTGPPFILPGSGNPSTDVWSSNNDPYEYIRTTANGARNFNDTPDLGAKVLWNNIPVRMRRGATASARVIVRNEGDLSWNNASGVMFGQDRSIDPVVFCSTDVAIDDTTNEIPIYEGIFRGRPIEFNVQITAPQTPGTYLTHWGMTKSGVGRFGEQIPVSIEVVSSPVPVPAAPTDAGSVTRSASIQFNWTEVIDTFAGTKGYNCRIGTTPGGSDVFDGYVGNVLSKTILGVDGKTYYCRVQAVANDGCTSSWSASSDGILLDMTPPSAPGTPVDEGFYTENRTITFTWTPSTDTGSGVVDYFCRIGTVPNGADVFSGYVGNVLSKTVNVEPRHTYYCCVLAKDAAGNTTWSDVSNGIGVVDAADEPLGLVKARPNGEWIGLTLPVSAVFRDFFYIQDVNGLSGIQVLSTTSLPEGSLLQVYGSLGLQYGERFINAVKVQGL